MAITMALVPLVIVLYGYEYYAVRKDVLQEIRVQADIVGDSVAGAMAFSDAEAASETIGTLRAAASVKKAVLILPDGQILASYVDETEVEAIDNYPDFQDGDEALTLSRFALRKAVYLKSNYVGSLVVEASLGIFYQRIGLYFIVIIVTTVLALALSLWLAAVLRDSITKPLSVLLLFVNRVTRKQDFSVRPKAIFPDEIGELSRAFGEMMSNIQERDERLQELAFYDKLTGLPNRNFFQDHIRQAVNRALRYRKKTALMYIDLDDFKKVNDTLGHDVGDQLLGYVSGQIKMSIRNTDRVFRIGGDEFSIILEDLENDDTPALLAEKVMKKVSEPYVVNGHTLNVTMSIGISFCPSQADNAGDLLKFADKAMYVAKNQRKNTYQVYANS